MSQILQVFNQIAEFFQPYLNRKYFLCIIGSIFLFGIVGQWITTAIYGRLIKKAENMVSPKNKMLKQLKMKFENCIAVNGIVANPTLMVERYINKYKFLGISLGGFARITNVCAVLCLVFGGVAGFVAYETGYDGQVSAFYVLIGCFLASALDMFSRSTRIEAKEGELICIITDFLVNTLNIQERRQERTANTLKMLAEAEEREKSAKERRYSNNSVGDVTNERISMAKRMASYDDAGEDSLYEPNGEFGISNDSGGISSYQDRNVEDNEYQWEILHRELEEEEAKLSEFEKLKRQEYIINAVLAEFL